MKIRPWVFWPPFVLLAGPVVFSLLSPARFLALAEGFHQAILQQFSWLFTYASFAFLVACALAVVLPLGSVRLGGPGAKPLFPPWKWFCVTLCSTVAVGILFWSTAEPVFHLHSPPRSLALVPQSSAAAQFAMRSLYMHWTFIPYAIYTLPAVVFAFAFYNMKREFSLSSCLSPLVGTMSSRGLFAVVDAICLYALVAGMAASLGAGIMTISGGLQSIYGLESSLYLWWLIGLAVVVTFVASAATGLQKGIRILSDWNARVFFFLVGFVLVMGPTAFLARFGLGAFIDFMKNFLSMSLLLGFQSGDPWPQQWTVFYWANWLAWAPVTAVFLGRIGYGYTIRQFIGMNLLAPAIFGAFWMAVFGGMAVYLDQVKKLPMAELLSKRGAESMIYVVFEQLPYGQWVIPLFLFAVFLSYVTGADSNTSVMAGLSSKGMTCDDCEPSTRLKIIWGATVGILAVLMISFSGIDGIRVLSNLGGLPALIFECAVFVAFAALVWNHRQLDKMREENP